MYATVFLQFFISLKLHHSFEWYAYIFHAMHNSFLFKMHHCVTGGKRLWNAQHKSSFINSSYATTLWWRWEYFSQWRRREQLRYMCLRFEWNCVPFKRVSEAEKKYLGRKMYVKKIIQCDCQSILRHFFCHKKNY